MLSPVPELTTLVNPAFVKLVPKVMTLEVFEPAANFRVSIPETFLKVAAVPVAMPVNCNVSAPAPPTIDDSEET